MAEERKMPPIVREVLRVVRKELLTPNYMRIVLGGEAVAKYEKVTIGNNNKIFIPPPGAEEIHFPQNQSPESAQIAEDQRPAMRTYTCRAIDFERREMTIDFALHGDEGIASAWALNSKIGDRLGVAMKAVSRELYPAADWYLLVGDATAIPVLSVILETLPKETEGIAYIEVQSKEDEQSIETASQVEIRWIHNPTPGKTNQLSDAVRASDLPENTEVKKFAYVAAEFETVRAVRAFLRKEKNWQSSQLDAFAYWKLGTAEDKSAAARRDESHEK